MCYCYRPPSALSMWTENVEKALEQANLEAKEIIMLGDFNFNLMKETSGTKQWLQITDSINLKQLVTDSTRVTGTTKTLIDHVYSNVPENIVDISVPVLSVSDHYPVCITRKLAKSFDKRPVHKYIRYRDTKRFNETDFLNDLENQTWSVIDIFEDASDALNFFSSIFSSVLSNHAPKVQRRVKRQKQPNWINTESLQARKKRDQYKKSSNIPQYNVWRNKGKQLIKI